MKCSVLLYALAAVAILIPCGLCDRADEPEQHTLRRNRRTVQFLVDHFVHFLGLSGGGGPKKIEHKQDNVFALPFSSILKASAGKFSGSSGTKQKPPASSHREPTLQHDLPTWIDDRQMASNPFSEALEADSLEPTRVSLLSTTREPEPETTSTTTTTEAPVTTTTEAPATTTPEAAPVPPTDVPQEQEAPEPTSSLPEQTNGSTSAPAAEGSPQEDADSGSSTDAAPIDPSAVNTLTDTRIDVRNDIPDDSFQPTPVPLVSYQHYVQPAGVWPGSGFQQHYSTQQHFPAHQHFPAQQYFGNNVFYPAQAHFPLASPFQVQQQQQHSQGYPSNQPSQGYPSNQPLYDNRLYYPTADASAAKSHSRVKLHDNPYDLVTYHDDSEPAASNYQTQMFGNYRARRY